MAALIAHGAQCCGIRHIYGMDNVTVAELDRLIGQVEANRLIEIVLSERQVTGDRWHQSVRDAGGMPAILAARGFRLVSRFMNSNSDNNCYIFHRVPRFASIQPRDLPFEWTHNRNAVNLDGTAGLPARPVTPPAPPAPPPVRELMRQYRNCNRDGSFGAWFDTMEECHAARGRRASYQVRVYQSNGQHRTDRVEY